MDFNKFFLVFKREYFSRLKSKTFIITTILAPVGFLMLFLIPIAVSSLSSERERIVYVVDETGTIDHRLVEANPGLYRIPDTTEMDELRGEVMARKVDAYVYISESVITNTGSPELVYGGAGGLMFIQGIRSDIQSAVRDELLDRSDVNPEVREIFGKRVGLQTSKLTETGEEETDTTALFIVGLVFGIVIYAAMFIYGAIIMRSVIEEKSSRIIEVITSAVKPLELLLGKVIGVGALGMTQFLIWIIAISGIGSVAGMLMLGTTPDAATGEALEEAAASGVSFSIPDIGIELWVGLLVFFLLGYLIYSALFAAVGSAVESETDSQQLTLPISIPIIIAMLLINHVASDPDSTLSVVSSMFPLFTPMLMPVRMAVLDVPLWQILGSIVLMALTFMLLMWLSARIYRVGMLMYGKKAGFRELARWVRYSE
ncbi:MAG: ABC transporter permease [Rhodothermaceae bacterium]|nr:ABC transporter permease [Rhodothermaceae bacterium]